MKKRGKAGIVKVEVEAELERVRKRKRERERDRRSVTYFGQSDTC